MSGVLSALAAGPSTYLVVGVASVGGGIFGFQLGSGTINGLSNNAPLGTATIDLLRSNSGGQFQLELTSVVSASFFKRLAVQTSAGARVILLASDAAYSNPVGGTKSLWTWTVSAPWDSASTRIVEVSF